MLDGGCSCGRVRFRLLAAPITVNCCHCRDCQRRSGSAFALNAMIEDELIELLGPAAPVVVAGADGQRSWICADCAVQLFAEHPMMNAQIRFVAVGRLDKGEALAPDAHYFTRSKHPWIVLPAGVPAYEALPGPGEITPRSDDAAARMARAWR